MSTTATSNEEQLRFLRGHIDAANSAYHNGESFISDREYDHALEQLAQLAPDDPRLSRVGAEAPEGSPLAKVEHTITMGSTFKVNSHDEFKKWHDGVGGEKLIGSLKLDGISLALTYENGRLVRAVTRGDGFVGEDVTHNAILFRGVPRSLTASPTRSIANFTGVVRGEVVMSVGDWKEVDPNQESNPRNLAAGIARRKSDQSQAGNLSFYAFDMIGEDHSTKKEQLEWLKRHGFGLPIWETISFPPNAEKMFGRVTDCRSSLPYWIDGVIFELNDRKLFANAGVTSNKPKGMIAWKFEATEVVTTLRKVTWQIGASQGAVTPVAHFDTVEIDGTQVSKASLANWDEIQRLGIGIGSVIKVIKANDIIPKVLGLALEFEQCGTPIEKPKDILGYRVNHRTNTDGSPTVHLYVEPSHPDVQRGKIKTWIKKLDIQGIGDEVLDALMAAEFVGGGHPDFIGEREDDPGRQSTYYNAPVIATVADLYRLHEEPRRACLFALEVNGRKLGKARAQKILDEIDKKRKLTVKQLLGSLGIDKLGRRRVELIQEACGEHDRYRPLDELDYWFTASNHTSYLCMHAEHLSIPGIAPQLQRDIDDLAKVIRAILDAGVTVAQPKPKIEQTQEHPLSGKAVCFTGCRPGSDMREMLERYGITLKSGVSKNLDLLVVKDASATSSKSNKAKELGVEVIDMDTFQERLKT